MVRQQTQPFESGFGEDGRVTVSVLDPLQSGSDVASQFRDAEVSAVMQQLSSPSRTSRGNTGGLRQLRQRADRAQPARRNQNILSGSASRDPRKRKPRNRFSGQVFQTVDRQVSATVQHRMLHFARKNPHTAEGSQVCGLVLIALRSRDDNLDRSRSLHRPQDVGDVLGLPHGECAASRGDADRRRGWCHWWGLMSLEFSTLGSELSQPQQVDDLLSRRLRHACGSSGSGFLIFAMPDRQPIAAGARVGQCWSTSQRPCRRPDRGFRQTVAVWAAPKWRAVRFFSFAELDFSTGQPVLVSPAEAQQRPVNHIS